MYVKTALKCYKVGIKQIFSSSIHKYMYNVLMLSHSTDFVHQFLECDLNFASCKHNYVFLKNPFFSLFQILYCLFLFKDSAVNYINDENKG